MNVLDSGQPKKRKAIILAGGTGSRLHPMTQTTSKHLLPIYDKPMIYYPLSALMLADIRDYLVITTPAYVEAYRKLLGDGTAFGINISYKEQAKPRGLPEAYILGEDFIDESPSVLILGDNLFFGANLGNLLKQMNAQKNGMSIFAYPVQDPSQYGVIVMDKKGMPQEIVEKPTRPLSKFAIPGVYFCDAQVVQYAKDLSPSKRGELEITDIIRKYLSEKNLHVQHVGRGLAWLDTGTVDSLVDATNFVAAIERRQGLKIACLEEIAYTNGWLSKPQIEKRINALPESSYAKYLKELVAQYM